MRYLALAMALFVAACAADPINPDAFVAPDDCYNIEKHDHPAYVGECGGRQ